MSSSRGQLPNSFRPFEGDDSRGELDARGDVELPEDRTQVVVDGVTGHERSLRDLSVGEAVGDEVGNGALGVGEAREAQRGAIRSGGSLEMHDDADGDAAVEDRLAP